MITFSIYNYKNQINYIQIEDKDIKDIFAIHTTILSGDECVKIQFKNGEIQEFDAALGTQCPRTISYYDGEYTLTCRENIDKWLDWTPTTQSTYSYNRQFSFS